MRSFAIVAAALAATVAASPVKRDEVIVTDTAIDLSYVTDVVTVTAGQEAAATSAAEIVETTTTAPAVTYTHYGHHRSWHASSSSAAPVVAPSSAAAVSPSTYSSAAAPSTSEVAAAPSSSEVASVYTSASAYSSSVASSSSSAPSASASTYQQAAVLHHNLHRANHSAPDLTWDDKLASIAASIAGTCVWKHNVTAGGGGYGQNIAAGSTSANISSVITDGWYNGEVNAFNGLYGQASPSTANFESWGHFSQVVWKDTTTVGCATVDCTNQAGGLQNLDCPLCAQIFTVCNYGPPGNYANEYGANIGSSLGQATVQWSQGLADPATGVTGSS